MFGDEALARTLADSHGLDAAATTAHIAAALAARHDGWASDDTALLALRVPPCASRPARPALRLTSNGSGSKSAAHHCGIIACG
jgi:hypothetical protein